MKFNVEYSIQDKEKWGDGPWLEEPDKMQWQDEYTGLPCLAVRNPSMGNWCGYVGVPEGHPAYGQDYDTDVTMNIVVHGGLTYANKCGGSICHVVEEGEDDNIWWLGFDCAHYGDLSPGMVTILKKYNAVEQGAVYRDLNYVRAECFKLALQLHTMQNQKEVA